MNSMNKVEPFLRDLDKFLKRVWAKRNPRAIGHIAFNVTLTLEFGPKVLITILLMFENGYVGKLALGDPFTWRQDVMAGRNLSATMFLALVIKCSKCWRCSVEHTPLFVKIGDEFVRSNPSDELRAHKNWISLCTLMRTLE